MREVNQKASNGIYPVVVFLFWICGVNFVLAEKKVHQLPCELDALLNEEILWSNSPTDLNDQFACEGFSKSPYFALQQKENRTRALFVPKPFSNIENELSIFGGSVSVSSATLSFEDEVPVRLRIDLGKFAKEDEAEQVFETCFKELQNHASTPAIPWQFRNDPTKVKFEREQSTGKNGAPPGHVIIGKGFKWESSRGTMLLDHSQVGEHHAVRIRMVPAQQIGRLLEEEFQDSVQLGVVQCSLDSLFRFPDVWNMTTKQFEQRFTPSKGLQLKQNPFFQWLTADKSRARFYCRPFSNQYVDLRIMGGLVSAKEVIVDFQNKRVKGITISVYNASDAGQIPVTDFFRLQQTCGKFIGKQLAVKPKPLPVVKQKTIPIQGYRWDNPSRGVAFLEYNPEALDRGNPQPSYLRIRLQPRIPNTLHNHSGNIARETNGDIWIRDIPMVDQGNRGGYCVVACCQRVMEYLSLPVDQYQMAPIFGVQVGRGVLSQSIEPYLNRIFGDFSMKSEKIIERTYFSNGLSKVDISSDGFRDAVIANINQGIPLLWSMRLSVLPERGLTPVSSAQSDGHMRLIIGYNIKTNMLIYSDTWGLGHERKKVELDAGYLATTRVFKIVPRGSY